MVVNSLKRNRFIPFFGTQVIKRGNAPLALVSPKPLLSEPKEKISLL